MGVLNLLEWPIGVAVVVAVVILDFAIYLQHVVFHAVPLLWRLHRMHHADLDVDVTTGARFHPIEVTLSMVIKLAVVVLIGAPPWAVLIFEVLLNATSMFNHSNVRIPERVEWVLRCVVVTPTCTASTIRSFGRRPTATSDSTCPGGTGCSGRIGPIPPKDRQA